MRRISVRFETNLCASRSHETGCGVASQKIYWQVTGPLRTSPSRSLHGRFRKRKKKSRFSSCKGSQPRCGQKGVCAGACWWEKLTSKKSCARWASSLRGDQQKKCCCAPLQMTVADDHIKSCRPREAAEERGQPPRTSQWHALGNVGARVESL